MNDRFKFRFYDNNKKIMIDENSDIEYIESIYNKDEWYWCIEANMPTFLDYFDGGGFVDGKWCKFNFAIMQCTGLKDKNGKLIYEGDILKTKEHNLCKEGELFKVFYQKTLCQFLGKSLTTDYCIDLCDLYEDEVIGNIYENKELLESEG